MLERFCVMTIGCVAALTCPAAAEPAKAPPAPSGEKPAAGAAEAGAAVTEGKAQLAALERLIRAKDGAGVRAMVLIGKEPDAEERLTEFADAVAAGALADARVIAFDGREDGGVTVVATAFLKKPRDPRPDVEPTYFVKRDGKLRMIFGSSGNHAWVLTDPEREPAARLAAWYATWSEANRDRVRKESAKRE